MGTRWIGTLSIASAGCFSTPGIHPTLHPAAPGSGPNAGIALGAAVQTEDDDTSMQIGYGEGWARIGPGGAVELRTTPQAAFAAVDIPVAEGDTAVSVRPSIGLAVTRFTDTMMTGMKNTTMTGYLHPGVSFVIQSGSLYAAPRIGFQRSEVFEGRGEGASSYSVAGTIGLRLVARTSLELTVIYSRDFEDPANTRWTFVPSLGIGIGE